MIDFVGGDEFDPEAVARAEDAAYDAQVANDDAVAQHIRRSKEAYTRVFKTHNPSPEDVAFVMHDLAWFCKAYDPQWQDDQRQQDRYVARREVYQRIAEYSSLDSEVLMKRYVETQN